MWGGVKKRTQYGDLFRRWSASQGLEGLRTALFKEPRPWYIAYTLHQGHHLLQDHHCARLLAWSTSIVELRPSLTGKQQAYRYTQEMFNMLVRHHKVGGQSLDEYMRLCAVGKDLSSAFDWFNYWQEAQLGDYAALHTLTWLLHVAAASPHDERVEDMALTVMELYTHRFAPQAVPGNTVKSTSAPSASSTSAIAESLSRAPVDEAALRRFFCAFKSLAPRIASNARLHQFLGALPVTAADAALDAARHGWPTSSSHRLFPQLEQRLHSSNSGATEDVSDYNSNNSRVAGGVLPPLRDSLLHPGFVHKLQTSAARHDVAAVVALVETYEARLVQERERTSGGRTPALRQRASEEEFWCSNTDPTAAAFRRRLVEDGGGGVTPELYHYLITALAATQPTAALRTLQRMEEAQLRPLDVTRTAVLVAAQDSDAEQRRLFKQQLDEVQTRAQLDEDHGTVKAVEAYWKYDYVAFFHYRNALALPEFYELVLHRLGPQRVQRLLLGTGVHGPTASAEDLVLLDEDLRTAACRYFRAQVGAGAAQRALDEVSTHMPQLDISLVGSTPHFADYCLDSNDGIANDVAALQRLVQPFDTVYVLDASFVETSESFLTVGAGDASPSLVLVPHLCLAQLASSVASAHRFVSFDPALQQAVGAEPFLASQRLRGLFAMMAAPSAESQRRTRVLHFTECLCAHQVDAAALVSHGLDPGKEDDDQLLLVLAMLSSLKSPATRLILCAEDAGLLQRLEQLRPSALFAGAVEVIQTAPPATLDVTSDLIDDNPVLRDGDVWASRPGGFAPRLDLAAALPARTTDVAETADDLVHPPLSSASTLVASTGDTEQAPAASDVHDSPWLALLNDDDAEVTEVAGATASPPPSDDSGAPTAPAPPSVSVEEQEQQRARLMSLYETPFDVVPVGVKMEKASAEGSVFAEFDSMAPEEREAQAADRAAARSNLSPDASQKGKQAASGQQRRRRSVLETEMLRNRGASNRDRLRMARQLSNRSGGRVPFNLRYRVVEANVRDPRNAHLRRAYEAAVDKKRASFKRKFE